MKHPTTLKYATRLEELCQQAGLVIGQPELRCLVEYVVGVEEANARLNLTRITGIESALRLHVVDSLLALPEVQEAPAGALLDLGSGAGFPGVPLGVASHRSTVLLDSVGKKAAAVHEIVAAMGLDTQIQVRGERAETLALKDAQAFAVVTARAVAQLPSLVELAAPLLAPNAGRLIALKGVPDAEELERGRTAARLCGLREVSIRRAAIPEGSEARTIIAYERYSAPRVKLPRRMGLAQHSPLA